MLIDPAGCQVGTAFRTSEFEGSSPSTHEVYKPRKNYDSGKHQSTCQPNRNHRKQILGELRKIGNKICKQKCKQSLRYQNRNSPKKDISDKSSIFTNVVFVIQDLKTSLMDYGDRDRRADGKPGSSIDSRTQSRRDGSTGLWSNELLIVTSSCQCEQSFRKR